MIICGEEIFAASLIIEAAYFFLFIYPSFLWLYFCYSAIHVFQSNEIEREFDRGLLETSTDQSLFQISPAVPITHTGAFLSIV